MEAELMKEVFINWKMDRSKEECCLNRISIDEGIFR